MHKHSKGLKVNHLKKIKEKAVREAKERKPLVEFAWIVAWTVAVFFATLLWLSK